MNKAIEIFPILDLFHINCGLTKIDNHFYVIHRYLFRHGMGYGKNETWMSIFNKDWKIIKKTKLNLSEFAEDPRIVLLNDNIFVFVNCYEPLSSKVYMWCYKLNKNGNVLSFNKINYSLQKIEKNWTPFIFNDEIYLSYNVNPHTVLKYDFDSNKCELINKSNYVLKNWKYGIIRGGTNGIKINEKEYLEIFHSTIVHGRSKYSMGAFIFNPYNNFEITKITKEPILIDGFFNEKNLVSMHTVIFPCGLLFENEEFLITCGQNDSRSKLIKIKKEYLLEKLVNL